MYKKNAFTLTEVLMALAIVGVIAVLTVPALMGEVHNKVYASQIKNMASTIEQLAQDQLVVHRTRNLEDTDFATAADLLTDDHFSIAKKCADADAKKECWKTSDDAGKDKVTYKLLKGTKTTISSLSSGLGYTVILKNGVLMRYYPVDNGGKTVGYFTMDVNGNDGPNIFGRDLFGFYITPKGHVADANITQADSEQATLATKVNNCKNGGSAPTEAWCLGALMDNAWKMKY